jgi:hypothetical protein
MNERIEKLAEQAVLQANEVFDQKGKDYSGIVMEKFAELIIRECMSVADLPNNASGQWDHLLPSEVIGKHFGVAE